jgi:hypothetical protein
MFRQSENKEEKKIIPHHHLDREEILIDKSIFIKKVLDHKSNRICILRPDGFGKAKNFLFLKRFFESDPSKDTLSRSFKIWSVDNGIYQKYRNDYFVLFISFSRLGLSIFSSPTNHTSLLEDLMAKFYLANYDFFNFYQFFGKNTFKTDIYLSLMKMRNLLQ